MSQRRRYYGSIGTLPKATTELPGHFRGASRRAAYDGRRRVPEGMQGGLVLKRALELLVFASMAVGMAWG
jgi:hypothetical protein